MKEIEVAAAGTGPTSAAPADRHAVTLIVGGVRSGKSRFGQALAQQLGEDRVLMVATAQARDDEMRQRIKRHQADRPAAWSTLEQPLDVGPAVLRHLTSLHSETESLRSATESLRSDTESLRGETESQHRDTDSRRQTSSSRQTETPRVVLLDCLTLLVSNLLCDEASAGATADQLQQAVLAEVEALLAVARRTACHLIVVSGEVGCGIVPEHPLGRSFRDLLGLANQRLAAAAQATYWMVAGMAIPATQLAMTVEQAAAIASESTTSKVQS
ncbi:bifunctional adenosylcobinamide kinase/adenosylcobinamide-phosphate guanylyltransferase [Roseimaritima sediminicola]|uniref:bifunctional adenosylcobinamide kinase/adenosylcobinamide-phosphate guanylyltransferase n=1 Tax=Roseimaritima sediminicola TaxID=2662066 RepID=UPI0012984B9F|nr:bifunctional adenosylcobinamide kinase/adenosylcobinamide-phosphate guanylyltransferase [Roseimaritima sediminicola]